MKKSLKAIASVFILGSSQFLSAQNPIIQTNYTADPAPMVYKDRMYLYTSHDEDEASWFVMDNWKLYTTDDMVNWTDHGTVANYKTFEWGIGDAWAIQVVERNDKFYLYAPVKDRKSNRSAIGVAVSDSPYGPFYDPIGAPLVQSEWGDIDPTAFVDDDGQAYLYWGNPKLKYVKLNEDMISFSGSVVETPMTEASFGKREGNVKDRPTLYEEGPWLYKRKDLYYLLWAGGPLPEHIGYSTSKSPLGPWKNQGTLMPKEGGSFTNHPGMVDFRGKTYFFYHNGALPGGHGFNRSVAVDEADFNKDGSIKPLKMTEGIKKSLKPINAFQKTEAETIAFSEGVKAKQNKEVGVFVNGMKDGAYTKVREVDFGKGASKITMRVGTTHNTGVSMEVRVGNVNGQLLTTIKVPITGGDDRWSVVTADLATISGVHDMYFVFKGENKPGRIAFFDYWMLSK